MFRVILISFFLFLSGVVAAAPNDERIVVLTGDAGEIVCALDSCKNIVGREQAATYPPEILSVKEIGYHRSLNPEVVLSVNPTLVLGSNAVQPLSLWEKINQTGIKTIKISEETDGSDFSKRIEIIGAAIGKSQQAKTLAEKWAQSINSIRKSGNQSKRYLVSLDGNLVAGNHTPADTLIKWAGGINVAAEAGIDGYKTMNREAWIKANPDIVILTEHGQARYGSVKDFSKRPEVSNTSAAQKNNIYVMNADLILRVGMRSPDIIKQLQTWK